MVTSQVIVEQLKDLGYTIAGVTRSGTETVQLARDLQPDLILMDITLKQGDIDGIDAAAIIFAERQLPIIYLTANTDAETIDRAKGLGAYGYILKPFTQVALQASIEVALSKHQLEQHLAYEKTFSDIILRSMADSVLSTDRYGSVTYLNPAAEVLTGWDRETAIGQAIETIAPLIDYVEVQPLAHPVREVLHTGEVAYLKDNVYLVNRQGDAIPISDSVSPLLPNPSNIEGAVMVIRNIKDQLKLLDLQQETKQAAQLLQLEQQLSQLRSYLIQTVSHEYRTPLAMILTSTEILENSLDQLSLEHSSKYLFRIRQGIKRLTQLIEDIEVFNQAEAGKLPFTPQPTNIVEICQSLITEIQDYNLSHSIQFINHSPKASTTVLDQRLIRYILGNLLSNAVKYSPDQTPVTLSYTATPNHLVFQVEDQGMGIPVSDRAQLFEPFFRASNVGTVRGTGMGLSIVKLCVDIHQGTVMVTSEEGSGTTFQVILPNLAS